MRYKGEALFQGKEAEETGSSDAPWILGLKKGTAGKLARFEVLLQHCISAGFLGLILPHWAMQDDTIWGNKGEACMGTLSSVSATFSLTLILTQNEG